MGKYGEVAVRAVGLMLWDPETSPPDAWEASAARVFPDSSASQAKSCPRSAFLGLCEEGVVAGVARGDYTRSQLNRDYAIRGLMALRSQPDLSRDQRRLWIAATDGKEVRPNGQMEVLSALWDVGLVR